MSSNPIFTPVQASEAQIKDLELQNGWLYFATDSGRMYLDTDTKRISVGGGGGGVAIYYGNTEEPEKDEEADRYSIPRTDVPDSSLQIGDLILNSDGGFYKVLNITEEYYICTLLSISGTGSIVGPASTKPKIQSFQVDNVSVINGQKAYFTIKGESAKDADIPVDTTLNITYSLGTKVSTVVNNYYTQTMSVTTDESGKFEATIEYGSYLKQSATSVLSVYVWGLNHDEQSVVRNAEITSSALKLNQLSSYTPATRYSVSGFTLSCNVIGGVNKILKCYYDGELLEERMISSSSANSQQNFNIPAGAYDDENKPIAQTATHGYHTVKFELCQNLGNDSKPVEGLYVEPLQYEIAVIKDDPEYPPVIWLGDYKSVYYTYDTIQVPFLVWDPASTSSTKVHLYKNKIELESSPREISDFTKFNSWEIADADSDQLNTYQISCGETDDRKVEREIQFTIEPDPNRKDFVIESGDLNLNFMATGRSNSEPGAKRSTWSYDLNGVKKYATFDKFNWFNNGWRMDPSINTSCLRISNGAEVRIPYQAMTFASNSAQNQSHTVEMQFKISNISKYDNLITNITRYEGDGDWYDAFKAQKDTGYSNYDAYLQATLTPAQYENLKYVKVEKVIQIDNVVGGLYDFNTGTQSAIGFCLGTQDAFFSNGTDTVNVNFVENEMINISFVYQHSLKQLYIYINGCISGVIKSSIEDGKTFNITNSDFVFNSKYCDIDLYKLRVYSTDLNVSQIVKNFAIDRKDIPLFDQNKALAEINNTLKEYQLSFSSVEQYNLEHPEAPLMPYIIFDTGNADSRLPYSKADTKNITVEFVNTPLEQAYATGKLEDLARQDGLISENENDGNKIAEAIKTYYKHHCPSFTTSLKSSDKVKFEVQGTSSQFYPRRNYKIKTKMEGKFNWKNNADLDEEDRTEEGGAYTEEEALNIFMNRGPFAEDFAKDQVDIAANPKLAGYEKTRLADGWYMNNYTNPTDRWTMKVDYMESSGSYNAGFASLVGNAYTKHPLQDYIKKGVLGEASKLKPVVTTNTADSDGMRWQDFRTSLLGFPVMAFWRKGTGDNVTYTFIGYYRMLLDKSSTQVLGFKTPKKVTHKLFPDGLDDDGNQQYKRLRDVVECWEFSNNARGFCSYRDPWNRVELSFKAPKGVDNEYTAAGAPIVANSFEYRYHSKDDYIDILYAFDEATQNDLNTVASKLGLPEGSILAGKENRETGADALLTTHKNWEKVCKWLWSTNLDAVESQGIYTKVPVGNREYKTDGTFFVINSNNEYEPSTEAFDKTKVYYVENTGDDKDTNPYISVDAAPAEYVYAPGKFYYLAAGYDTTKTDDDVYALANDDYDGSIDYFVFEDGDTSSFNSRFDLLIRPVDINTETFNSGIQYYTWHGTDYDVNDSAKRVTVKKGSATGAVQKVTNPTKDDWDKGIYYVEGPVTYAGKTYTHDTKEYRAAKFTNEFESHFDPEYVAAYFVMTEVMECYDSRGKNCMMASWGPQEEGGNYIWYPIFYDIDTQLGINNTGIPSFEYNVDATEAGNFSTSDSILWNNFYKFFKATWMIPKYRNLRGFNSKFKDLLDIDGTTKKSPLKSVDYIEKWYTFDPEVTHNIACEGIKPLIATNLDMFFKYITITNKAAKDQGVAHLDDAGNYAEPDSGTYFYALQGDRSQSRRQFVTNRLEYIDSWLTQGNYARGGSNRLWGRISANNRSDVDPNFIDVHSDKWTEGPDKPYWVDEEFGTKSHEFDAEYWLELKPIRSSYVTAGDDSENYPSKKYDGIHDMKFKISELENGIRTSNNYPEQLLYIYGTNQMSDFGDLSKMYWTEFKLEGNADRLTRLKLGHDGEAFDFENDNAKEKTNIKWYNKKLNGITLPRLPLLKEANFCNIGLVNPTALDFSESEKLENFRATGSSNINSIRFAQGVALNTLYVPSTITSLSLVQANLLTDLIIPVDGTIPYLSEKQAYYSVPSKNEAGDLVATKGLYLEGFFSDKESSSLNGIDLNGGGLGYNSYLILQRLFDKNYSNNNGAQITMQDVMWSPYARLSEGAVYDPNASYYKDNGHYGFATYNLITKVENNSLFDINKSYYTKTGDGVYDLYTGGIGSFVSAIATGLYTYDEKQFNADIISGLVYIDQGNGGRQADGSFSQIITDINDASLQMLINIYTNTKFTNSAGQNHPELSGLMYIHNQTPVNEDAIVTLQGYYPQMTFFFNKVNKAYSAKFVLFNPEDYSEKYVKWANGSTSPSVQKIQQYDATTYFNNPFDVINGFKPEKTHYDFIGWSLNNRNPYDANGKLLDSVITLEESLTWSNQKLQEDVYDYTYYAIFELHKYEIRCYNNNDSAYGEFFDPDANQKYNKINIEYGQSLATTGIKMPQASDATELEERNTFKGWTLNKNAGKIYGKNENLSNIIIDLSKYSVTKDYQLYAVFQEENVYDSTTDNKYFVFTYDDEDGYPIINLNPENGNDLSGKITLPIRDNKGNLIKGIGNMTGYRSDPDATYPDMKIGTNITHIFFEKGGAYQYLERYCFRNPESAEDHYNLYGIYLPDTITEIRDRAFEYMTKIKEVTLNDNINYIGVRAFRGQLGPHNMIEIKELPKNLKTIGANAFYNCDGISISTIPDNVEVLPEQAFYGCRNIMVDEFGKSGKLTSIGKNCFSTAGQLVGAVRAIYLHESVVELGSECFYQYGSAEGPSMIYTSLSRSNPVVATWDATRLCGNASAQISGNWNGVR